MTAPGIKFRCRFAQSFTSGPKAGMAERSSFPVVSSSSSSATFSNVLMTLLRASVFLTLTLVDPAVRSGFCLKGFVWVAKDFLLLEGREEGRLVGLAPSEASLLEGREEGRLAGLPASLAEPSSCQWSQ